MLKKLGLVLFVVFLAGLIGCANPQKAIDLAKQELEAAKTSDAIDKYAINLFNTAQSLIAQAEAKLGEGAKKEAIALADSAKAVIAKAKEEAVKTKEEMKKNVEALAKDLENVLKGLTTQIEDAKAKVTPENAAQLDARLKMFSDRFAEFNKKVEEGDYFSATGFGNQLRAIANQIQSEISQMLSAPPTPVKK